ncbi:TPA: carbohydrate porin [Acinetobacter nosocomialis]|uniref:Carbohydrate porin n=1 Tax=Acinetobacter nosocomialis TaxID=106654 RepID=A0AB37CUV4_ACINO|nr:MULTISPECIES: carbohydrate porin [Acinetobacter calcoaceticus/baumannii complex]ELW85583.1 carbohydrate-selective porin, OprB family [Acinetobacter sp. OIFC021]EXE46697.1 porin B [Acinetobacter sp. 766875]MDE1667421.1 carbohydrate porin [Acinetobacter nosocomialis]MDE9417862.1 carbohydrate porin [Acinetobacter nosocomialis]QGA44183.1 carbohydrate porin [Acinetobacter nosocomialis]
MPNVIKLSVLTIAVLSSQFALANEPWSQDRQWLLGDWNGERQQLEQQGYKFTASIMSQAATNLDGGYNDSNTFENAAQLSLGATFDLDKIAGWKDTTASLVVTKRDGNALTLERIKDPRSSQLGNAQEIYGRGKIWRLSQAWIKKGFADNTVQVKFGRMGMSEDFNSSQCEFQNLLLCGGQLGKSIGSIWYNSPVGVWAANVKYQFAPEWTLGVGVYEVNPDNIKTESNSDGFNLDMNNVKGATIPVELAWKPKLAAFNGLPGEYKVGALYSTAEANDIKTAGKVHDGKQSFWINAQQQLSHAGQDPKRGLYVSFNGVVNDKATTFVQSTQQLALWYKGPFDSRPNDSIGFGIANYVVNDRAKDKQIATNESRGYYSYDPIASNYIPIQDDELNVELNYTYQWSPAVMLRPNIQYIHQPAGVKEVDDAWVAGLSVKVNF